MAENEDFEKAKIRHASEQSRCSVSHYIPTPPDGGYGWVVVMASFFIHVIVDGVTFTFGVFYIAFLEHFNEGKGRTSLVGSLLGGFYLMICFVASALVNKFGCRPVSIAGSFLSFLGFFLSIFSPNIDVLMITYGVLGGSGFALSFFPSVIAVSFYFSKRRALATGIAVCGSGVGAFIMAPFGRYLLDIYDWKNAMLIVSGICLNGCVFSSLLRPLEPPRRKRRPRTKNVLDRLAEKTRRRREESECSTGKQITIMQKIQEVKLARETMLCEEESECGSEFGSVPNSTLTSAQNLQGSTPTKYIPIPAQDGQPERGATNFVSVTSSAVDFTTHSYFGGSPGHVLATSPTIPPSHNLLTSLETIDELPNQYSSKPFDIALKGSLPANDLETPEPEHTPNRPTPLNKHRTDIDLSREQNHNEQSFNSESRVQGKYNRNLKRMQEKYHEHLEDFYRPMYRKDIFYSGSTLNISLQSQLQVKTYIKSMLSIPDVPDEKESKCCSWLPRSVTNTVREMMDVSLFREPIFLVAAAGNMFAFIGLFVPFVFIADRASMLGINEKRSAFLLSVIGLTNMLGRLMAGFLADFKWINSLLLHNMSLLLAGVACVLNMFCVTYPLMCVYAALFGLCVATYISLTSIVLCNLLGIDRLTNAYGLLCAVRGIASIAGAPTAGAVLDATGNYDASFHLGGVMFFLAGTVFSLLHLNYFVRRNVENPKQSDPEFSDLKSASQVNTL